MTETFKRKIPENMRPWRAEVNGKRYTYEPGTEQEVPHEVAVLIDAYWEKHKGKFPDERMSYNDLKDTPCREETEVLFDQMVTFKENASDGTYYWSGTGKLGLVDGEKLTVTFEGNTYEVVAAVQEYMAVFGNAYLYDPNSQSNELPFYVSNVGNNITIHSYAPITTEVKIERMVAHTIDPKFLPNGGAGVGYESSEVLLNAEMYIHNDEDIPYNLNLDVEEGDTVRVTWDDAEYVCSVVSLFEGAVGFGNLAYIGLDGAENAGEPFVFVDVPGGGTLILAADGPEEYYIKIVKEQVHTIDPKFISAGGIEVVTISGSSDAYTADKTYAEIADAILAGKTVYATDGYSYYGLTSAFGLTEYASGVSAAAALKLPDFVFTGIEYNTIVAWSILNDNTVEKATYSLTVYS